MLEYKKKKREKGGKTTQTLRQWHISLCVKKGSAVLVERVLIKKWWKNDEAAGLEILLCVLCLISGGQEKHAVTGTTLFLPTDTEYVMKSDCERKKNGRQGGVGGDEARSMCVSSGSSSFLLHPFTFLHCGPKKKEKIFVCLRACVSD